MREIALGAVCVSVYATAGLGVGIGILNLELGLVCVIMALVVTLLSLLTAFITVIPTYYRPDFLYRMTAFFFNSRTIQHSIVIWGMATFVMVVLLLVAYR